VKFFLYLKLLLFSILGALTLSLISLYCLVRISDMAVEDYRYGYLMYVARAIERSNNHQPVSKINVNKVQAPPEPKGDSLNLVKITEFGPGLGDPEKDKRPKPLLWLVSKEGIILSTNARGQELPIAWSALKLPKKIHGIVSNEQKFIIEPKTFVVKLDTTPVTYLVSHNERTLFQGPYLLIQGTHTFATAALAVFLALSISFYYLRKKSQEARKVLAKLESGDLKARFEIKKFDETGNLLLDFNRMADEIEKLVMRLRNTEITRSNLLQELGHDLRTPLTSLSSAFETMRIHHELLSPEDKSELFAMIGTDIRYFRDLLEKLTLVASIDSPQYKATTERIHLHSLLETEVLSRKIASGDQMDWRLQPSLERGPVILGDSHLITRLFRNAFDNASRYASSAVTVRVNDMKDKVEVLVIDDGPGLSNESLQTFGKRRERRLRKEKDPEDFSLGLGSVIMKTIAQVHGGTLEMMNLLESGEVSGACLRIVFQKAGENSAKNGFHKESTVSS
jgi:signal transduction histidine kinase